MTFDIIPDNTSICLDTNVLVHFCRQNNLGAFIDARFGLSARPFRPFICEVTVGEIYSLARRLNWGAPRIALLGEILVDLPTTPICHQSIYMRYAELDQFAFENAGVRMGKNDLWIAAIASIADGYLITTDQDFFPLINFPLHVVYVDPHTQAITYTPPN